MEPWGRGGGRKGLQLDRGQPKGEGWGGFEEIPVRGGVVRKGRALS